MSLFIKNANLPESGSVLLVYADGSMGKAKTTRFGISAPEAIKAKAVPLPEKHGRLVDAREVLEKADKAPWFDGDVSELGLLLGSEVTTIIPAKGESDDGNQ